MRANALTTRRLSLRTSAKGRKPTSRALTLMALTMLFKQERSSRNTNDTDSGLGATGIRARRQRANPRFASGIGRHGSFGHRGWPQVYRELFHPLVLFRVSQKCCSRHRLPPRSAAVSGGRLTWSM